ncbi:protease inhibitor I42 family protein [Ruficoccus sp. ZRK36]|uniref:protease inhibitor I42 family protein n=1 Tax=Ruficoccus sp. ZRK36 TaxID=2866311 RepID=UPI001C72D6DD|nr:protease inhibitor I42 family protein [Ruficoccus sp. ZRK36]QYY36124.1 protease inhibitor I42 family protein [Ruficoccus sp. ZRK36]
MKYILSFCLLSLFSFFFSACQSGAGSTQSLSDGDTIGLGSNGSTLLLKVGESFVVSLPTNASTGYSWELSDSYKSVLRQGGGNTQNMTSDHQTAMNDGAPAMLGAPTLKSWTFTASKAGEAPLHFEYLRPWEKDSDPAKVFEVTIKVSE